MIMKKQTQKSMKRWFDDQKSSAKIKIKNTLLTVQGVRMTRKWEESKAKIKCPIEWMNKKKKKMTKKFIFLHTNSTTHRTEKRRVNTNNEWKKNRKRKR